MKGATETRQRDLCRQLADYADTYPDNRFLDEMYAWGNESGIRFTIPQADAIDDALTWWKRRLNGAVFDPERCPPGYNGDIWVLAGQFRDTAEKYGLPCTGRKLVYTELHRVIRRDNLDTDYAPWRDKDGKPGWVRMLEKIINLFLDDNQDTRYPYGLHQDIAQPGVIRSLNDWLVEQAKLDVLLNREKQDTLHCASTPQATPERRAAVRAYIDSRETQRLTAG